MLTAVNGFKKCSIWPYDQQVFTESDFIASMTTDIPVTLATEDLPLQDQRNENEILNSNQKNSERADAVQAIPININITKFKSEKNKPVKRAVFSSSDSENEVDNTPCLYCNGCYHESSERWKMCSMCAKWAHYSCAGVADDDPQATHVCALYIPEKRRIYIKST
ncbi:hypothetical protein RN001_010062 [Aquatica leii]|uniref:Zinc finger PHD-type domain-containing protein n=1 Tax=Aquatica leii TaxID=1421715 RepID=A0AAN7P8V9_9COLE|nr:hypothetical protein RN001_010062 [Aquatica leii]